jgi:prepilin-type processing-associated H-X9-DG protein
VIGVIVVLAVLGLLASAKAKNRAKTATCARNVQQLGVALQHFVTEFQAYPLDFGSRVLEKGSPQFGMGWNAALESTELSHARGPDLISTLSSGIWSCPSATHSPDCPESKWSPCSYGYNALGIAPVNTVSGSANPLLGLGGTDRDARGFPEGPPLATADVVAPNDMIAIGDGFLGDKDVVSDEAFGLDREPGMTEAYPGSSQNAADRHQSKANVVFCDGHVETISFKLLFRETTDTALRRWNRDHEPHLERLSL